MKDFEAMMFLGAENIPLGILSIRFLLWSSRGNLGMRHPVLVTGRSVHIDTHLWDQAGLQPCPLEERWSLVVA